MASSINETPIRCSGFDTVSNVTEKVEILVPIVFDSGITEFKQLRKLRAWSDELNHLSVQRLLNGKPTCKLTLLGVIRYRSPFHSK